MSKAPASARLTQEASARVATIAESDIERARAALADVTDVVPHIDADGLAAGATVLRALGRPAGDPLLLGRGETPWSPDTELAMPALLDWGVRERPGPALIIDHHAPEELPRPDQVALSGHGADPEVSTSVLACRSARASRPASWATARSRCRTAPGVPKTAIHRLVPLLNAPRRGPDGAAIRTALALLVEHEDPKAILGDPRIAECRRRATRGRRRGSRCAEPRRWSARAPRLCASARRFSCTRSPPGCGPGDWHRDR